MVEMSETSYILHHATEHSLVLMDEIGRGTSTYDGLALADACARHLAAVNRSHTLFATHYFELTTLAEPGSGIANVHLDAVEHRDGAGNESLVFMHAVKDGPADRSFGLQVAALAGLPQAVVRQARGAACGTGAPQSRRALDADDRASTGCAATDRPVCTEFRGPGRARRAGSRRADAQAGARSAVSAEVARLISRHSR